VDKGLGSSVDFLRGSVCGSGLLVVLWINSEEVYEFYAYELYVDLDLRCVCVDLLHGSVCRSRLK
jgi:hypothetical protein